MNRWKWMVIIGALYCTSVLPAQEVSDLFASLDAHYREHPPVYPSEFSSLAVKTVYDKYIPGGVQVHFNAAQSVIIDLDLKGSYSLKGNFWSEKESGGMEQTTRVLKTRIDNDFDDWYIIDFSPGMSLDPHFIIHRADVDSTVFLGKTNCCLHLFIPGDGFLYTAGHVNSMFDIRRRYTVEDGQLAEVPQTYYHVGLETVTTGSLRMSSDSEATTESIILPAGTPIKVLLNRGEFYLIAGPFGLTGWTHIGSGYYTPIKHLVFRGD